jgi:hypothetical protein
MNIGFKTWYSIALTWVIMGIPYIQFQMFPYPPDMIAYGAGYLFVPMIAGGIAKAFKGSFQNWFNGMGTAMFIGAVANVLTGVTGAV